MNLSIPRHKQRSPKSRSIALALLSASLLISVNLSAQTYSIWSNPTPGNFTTTNPIEVGVKFRSDVSGYITGIRFYKNAQNTGTHTGSLWTFGGTPLATATFSGETASGWQQVAFSSPVAISANTVYVASYHSSTGTSYDNSYFTNSGVDNPPLHALQIYTGYGANGVYSWRSVSVFPSTSSSDTNYWVDVTFSTGQQPPAAISVNPSSSGNSYIPSQTFAFVGESVSGYGYINAMYMLFSWGISGPGNCFLQYSQPSNAILLYNDVSNSWDYANLGVGPALDNSHCHVDAANSFASGSGNRVTVNVALSFKPAFIGPLNVYLNVYDYAGYNSTWGQVGTWSAYPASPSPPTVSVSPASGAGPSQTFSFHTSDVNGYTYVVYELMLINSSLNEAGACEVLFNPYAGLGLKNDAGTAVLNPVLTPGVAGTVSNSQCTINGGASSVTSSGNDLYVNVAVTFASGFTGSKNVYMVAHDHANNDTGWVQVGSWTVGPVSQPPSAISVSPSSSGNSYISSQTFSFVGESLNGYGYINSMYMLFSWGISGPGNCFLLYSQPSNAILLYNDVSNSGDYATLGSGPALDNSHCHVDAVNSYASGSGNRVTVNVALSFKPAFLGPLNVYLNVYDNAGYNSTWQQVGTWSAYPASPSPPTVSVNPSSGTGTTQTFGFHTSDVNGYAYVVYELMLINSTLTEANACEVLFSPYVGLTLKSDSGTTLLNPVLPLGSTQTVSNSQCTIGWGTGSWTGSGNDLTVNVAITFASGFNGSKNVYMVAHDHANNDTGWVQVGSWAVGAGQLSLKKEYIRLGGRVIAVELTP